MRLALADEIAHETQPSSVSCVTTCIAMALGMTTAQLVADIGTISVDECYDPEGFAIWLAERGIWMRPVMLGCYGRGERLQNGTVYMVGVRSLNLVNSDHSVLLDTRGAVRNSNPRSGWQLFDPNKGREGIKHYDWVDEYVALDAHELRCRGGVGRSMGKAPVGG